jgi:hypothetical protein
MIELKKITCCLVSLVQLADTLHYKYAEGGPGSTKEKENHVLSEELKNLILTLIKKMTILKFED